MMNFNASDLLLTAGLYLSSLFMLAYITERGWIPSRLIKHPLTYVLSLGLAISIWSFYSAVMSASINGYGYTAYYTGYAAAFIFAPIFLRPILNITRTYQLSSIADLFAFRFRSPWAGTLTTITLLFCIFPMIGVQASVLESSLKALTSEANTHLLMSAFFLSILAFTILFGARDVSGRDKHQGLVMVIAFESIIKILILCGIGLYAVYFVFGGFSDLSIWLKSQPPQITKLEIPLLQNSTNLIILLFFSAAITMPHMFHMIFRENSNPANLNIARWGFPLLLLIVSVPILPILWAASYLNSPLNTQDSALAIGLIKNSSVLIHATFIGGLAAVFGIMVVVTMTVSSMCLNHLLLPLHKPKADTGLYHWLVLYRRFFMSAIILGAFCSYLALSGSSNIGNISYIAFIAGAQLLPGLITLLYWPSGNSKGFVGGLLAGLVAWFMLGVLPIFSASSDTIINWNMVTSLSLLSNTLALICVSLITRTSDEERSAGEMCSMDTSRRPRRRKLLPKTPQEFINLLSKPLGEEAATQEVTQAMKDLNIDYKETRSHSIQLLREQIEANLSGLLGPTISHQMVNRTLPYEKPTELETSVDVRVIESQLETYPGNLSGVALDLDKLRRHHRKMLQDLPIGVCSLNNNSEIVIWNRIMEDLTGISSASILGRYPADIEEPWRSLLVDFINDGNNTHIPKKSVFIDEKQHWLSLHKAEIEETKDKGAKHEGKVIVVEDFTETELLESGLAHSERLASIGRLAAGVAHEIGNPITGIACLAQNIRDEANDDDLRLMAEQIIQQTKRTSTIVQSLVNFSHNGTTGTSIENETLKIDSREPVSIYECANEAIQLISLNQAGKDIEFINKCQKNTKVLSDKQRLQQILVNLLTNSRDASAAGKRVSVTDSIISNQVSITVSDEGEGIPATIQDQIFEPFFTTKDPGKGTGLGLALVYSITEGLGGSIRIVSPTNKVSKTGTRVIVTFPCYYEKSGST